MTHESAKKTRKSKEIYSNCQVSNIFLQTNLQTLATLVNLIVSIEMNHFQVTQRMHLVSE